MDITKTNSTVHTLQNAPFALIELPLATTVLVTVLLACIGHLSWSSIKWHRKYKLPPTVKGALPIIGNYHQFPRHHHAQWAMGLAKQYGEMFTLKMGPTNIVFMNSQRVARALLESRSGLYMSRPPMPYTSELVSGGYRTLLMPSNDRWRLLRRIMHKILNARQEVTFKKFQDIESKHLLWDYLHTPERWHTAGMRYGYSTIMSVVYGRRSELGSQRTQDLFTTIEMFLGARPGLNFVDAFQQYCRHVPKPLQWWRAQGEANREFTLSVYRQEMEELKDRIARGVARDCFAKDLLELEEVKNLEDDQVLFILGTLMEAGTDTTRMTVINMAAAAAVYPEWAAKAREQLDAVGGGAAERLPQWDDREQLSYIIAAVKEGFRWRPNLSELGRPTMLIEDDEYEGYRFPAGTLFTWNAYAIALSEDEYEDPYRFMPERWLQNGSYNHVPKDIMSFGAGRRQCVGFNVGEKSVFIAMARLLYCFEFSEDPAHPIDTMDIDLRWDGNEPFRLGIKPRSEKHAELIRRDCYDAVMEDY